MSEVVLDLQFSPQPYGDHQVTFVSSRKNWGHIKSQPAQIPDMWETSTYNKMIVILIPKCRIMGLQQCFTRTETFDSLLISSVSSSSTSDIKHSQGDDSNTVHMHRTSAYCAQLGDMRPCERKAPCYNGKSGMTMYISHSHMCVRLEHEQRHY